MAKLVKFKKEDIEILSPMMKDAFNEDSQLFLGIDDGPEGYDNGMFLNKWFLHEKASPFCIVEDGKIIGGVNLWINKETNKNYLGCFFIDPKYENKGIGTSIWKEIENMYPDTIIWETETPIFSRRNHNFYVNKCGFVIYHIENPKDSESGSYLLKKLMK